MKMPRIDPLELLDCLEILLSPTGGIKSEQEVARVSSLMERFSKKLVSKSIYLLILEATDKPVLNLFMDYGGWNLVLSWLVHGIESKNWPLIKQILQVLFRCPTDIDRLKSNSFPRHVKYLSKAIAVPMDIKGMAAAIVKTWLRIVRAATGTETETESNAIGDSNALDGGCASSAVNDPDSNVEIVTVDSVDSANVISSEEADATEKQLPQKPVERRIKLIEAQPLPPEVDKVILRKKKKTNTRISSDEDVPEEKDADYEPPVKIGKRKIKLPNIENKIVENREPLPKLKISRDILNKARLLNSSSLGPEERLSVQKVKRKYGSAQEVVKKFKLSGVKSERSPAPVEVKKFKFSGVKSESSPAHVEVKKLKLSGVKPESSPAPVEVKKLKLSGVKPERSPAPVHTKKQKLENKKIVKKIQVPKKVVSSSTEKRSELEPRPKTVKMFNSKFRLTGLETASTTAPPKPAPKKIPPVIEKKKPEAPKPVQIFEDKKLKPAVDTNKSVEEENKPSYAKGLPLAKPAPVKIQESGLFIDAMVSAAHVQKGQQRKRKKPGKDDSFEEPKENVDVEEITLKPVKINFYNNILDSSKEHDSGQTPEEAPSEKLKEPSEKSESSTESPKEESENSQNGESEPQPSSGIKKGILKGLGAIPNKSKKKRSIQWLPDDEIEAVQYFEVDVTERSNVCKNFWDMQMLERTNEREALFKAKKGVEPVTEDKPWPPLILIELEPPSAVPGCNSTEKQRQLMRRKMIPEVVYYYKEMIPDSPAEPDPEMHLPTTPSIIPLDDVTGSADSVNDFSNCKWPDSKGDQPAVPTLPVASHTPPTSAFQQFPGNPLIAGTPPYVPSVANYAPPIPNQVQPMPNVPPQQPMQMCPPPYMVPPTQFSGTGAPYAGSAIYMQGQSLPLNTTEPPPVSWIPPASLPENQHNILNDWPAAPDRSMFKGRGNRGGRGSYNMNRIENQQRGGLNKRGHDRGRFGRGGLERFPQRDQWRNYGSDRGHEKRGRGVWRGGAGNSTGRICRNIERNGRCTVVGCGFFHPRN